MYLPYDIITVTFWKALGDLFHFFKRDLSVYFEFGNALCNKVWFIWCMQHFVTHSSSYWMVCYQISVKLQGKVFFILTLHCLDSISLYLRQKLMEMGKLKTGKHKIGVAGNGISHFEMRKYRGRCNVCSVYRSPKNWEPGTWCPIASGNWVCTGGYFLGIYHYLSRNVLPHKHFLIKQQLPYNPTIYITYSGVLYVNPQ